MIIVSMTEQEIKCRAYLEAATAVRMWTENLCDTLTDDENDKLAEAMLKIADDLENKK